MGEKRSLDVNIIWWVTQSDQPLQQLTYTGFCLQSVLGKWEHLL